MVEENNIIIRGEGRNTGKGIFGFLVKAVDTGSSGDLIKITIWDKLDEDKVIYDNLFMNELGGGYITIFGSDFAKVENKILSLENFNLEQNYPNPFNPTTTIRYSVPEKSFVTLKVYDIIGNEVVTLINEEKEPGSYVVTFNATNYVSGVYIYSIKSGNFVVTKKMILMK